MRSQPAYRVGRGDSRERPDRNMEDIMYEILTQGPVQAVIRVHTDLLMYSSGVYSLTNLARHRLAGHHAVKIVGWGVEGATRSRMIEYRIGQGPNIYHAQHLYNGNCSNSDLIAAILAECTNSV